MNMFARFVENPAMTLQDIKETKRYGRTDTRTDNMKTVVCGGGGGGGGGINMNFPPSLYFIRSDELDYHQIIYFTMDYQYYCVVLLSKYNNFTVIN